MKLHVRILIACIDLIRPLFGMQNSCCIYPVSCTDYAKHQLATKPFYYAIPKIILRLLSCNPLTAWMRRK
ncbi:MAG: membrane protein insertion efficiency factor YidD [bacterium]